MLKILSKENKTIPDRLYQNKAVLMDASCGEACHEEQQEEVIWHEKRSSATNAGEKIRR